MSYDIYSNSLDNSARFTLGKSGARPLFVLGLNPSTADQETPDQTAVKIEGVAQRHRYDGFVIVNLYPLRATRPEKLPRHCDAKLAEENFDKIREALAATDRPVILAAWGDAIEHRPFLFCCLASICVAAKPYSPRWMHSGPLTKSGNPRHLARLSYAAKWGNFPIEAYLQKKLQRVPEFRLCDRARKT